MRPVAQRTDRSTRPSKRPSGCGELGFRRRLFGEEMRRRYLDRVFDPETGRDDERTLFPVIFRHRRRSPRPRFTSRPTRFVDYEVSVARYWPEFARNGKGSITVRHILTHQSGVPQMPEGVTPELMSDWDWMIARFSEHCPGSRRHDERL